MDSFQRGSILRLTIPIMTTATKATRTAPEKKKTTPVIKALSEALADTYLLMVKTHKFHWNVEGEGFFQLHKAFEEQYNELFEAVDEIAERIRAIGGYAPGGLGEFGELSTINETRGNVSHKDMARILAEDNEHTSATARKGAETAEDADDIATADLLTARVAAHDKAAWMLRAYLGGK